MTAAQKAHGALEAVLVYVLCVILFGYVLACCFVFPSFGVALLCRCIKVFQSAALITELSFLFVYERMCMCSIVL